MKKFTAAFILAMVTTAALVAFKPSSATEGVTVMVTHTVKDYSAWRKGFDADAANRKKAGFVTEAVYTSVENPNEVTMLFNAPSVEAVNGMLSSPELKANMEKAGVISKPEAKILYKK